MEKIPVDFLLVPDGGSARKARKLLAEQSPGMYRTAGTWPELMAQAAAAYAVPNEMDRLYKAMGGFATNGVNMTKLESRPAKKGKTFKYYFYIDIDGHINDPNISTVIDKHKLDIKWLGSYVKMC